MEWPTDPSWRLVEAFLTVEARKSYQGVLTEATEHWDVEIWGWVPYGRNPQSYGIVGRLRELPGVIVGVGPGDSVHRTAKTLGLARKQAREMAQVFACGRGALCPGLTQCCAGGVPCPYHLNPRIVEAQPGCQRGG